MPLGSPIPATVPGSAIAGNAGPANGGRLPPGALLNSIYEVRRFLARGGMGEVYEGVNVNTDERVAIKVMLPQLAADPKIQAMFRKEARILTELAHPALVRYRVLAQEPELGLLYIVTEFISGRSLAELMGERPASVGELKVLARRLAEGLASAHSLGAVHRDMSPDNVLLPDGRLDQAKIIDFGIARESGLDQQTVIGDTFAGKLGFVAPEQFGDFGRAIGPWTDVYSLGLVLLAAAAGKAPDMGCTLVDAVDRRREGIDLAPLPGELRPLLEKMLAPNPKDRWQNMAEVLAALDILETPPAPPPSRPAAALEPRLHAVPQAAAAPPPSESSLEAPPARRSKAGLILGLGALVAFGGGLVFALTLNGPAKPPQSGPAATPISAYPEAKPLEETVAPVAAPAAPQAAPSQPVQAVPAPAVAIPGPIAAPAPRKPIEAKRQAVAAKPAAPVQIAAAASEPAIHPEPQAATTTAALPTKDYQACWRAVGSDWAYLGYASRASCAAQAFDKSCQIVHGRWGKDQLRRYNGKIEAKGSGALSRWRTLGPSTCPEPGAAR